MSNDEVLALVRGTYEPRPPEPVYQVTALYGHAPRYEPRTFESVVVPPAPEPYRPRVGAWMTRRDRARAGITVLWMSGIFLFLLDQALR